MPKGRRRNLIWKRPGHHRKVEWCVHPWSNHNGLSLQPCSAWPTDAFLSGCFSPSGLHICKCWSNSECRLAISSTAWILANHRESDKRKSTEISDIKVHIHRYQQNVGFFETYLSKLQLPHMSAHLGLLGAFCFYRWFSRPSAFLPLHIPLLVVEILILLLDCDRTVIYDSWSCSEC